MKLCDCFVMAERKGDDQACGRGGLVRSAK